MQTNGLDQNVKTHTHTHPETQSPAGNSRRRDGWPILFSLLSRSPFRKLEAFRFGDIGIRPKPEVFALTVLAFGQRDTFGFDLSVLQVSMEREEMDANFGGCLPCCVVFRHHSPFVGNCITV